MPAPDERGVGASLAPGEDWRADHIGCCPTHTVESSVGPGLQPRELANLDAIWELEEYCPVRFEVSIVVLLDDDPSDVLGLDWGWQGDPVLHGRIGELPVPILKQDHLRGDIAVCDPAEH